MSHFILVDRHTACRASVGKTPNLSKQVSMLAWLDTPCDAVELGRQRIPASHQPAGNKVEYFLRAIGQHQFGPMTREERDMALMSFSVGFSK